MNHSKKITLTITVTGPRPWSRFARKMIEGRMEQIAEYARAELRPFHELENLPPDWKAVRVKTVTEIE